MEELLQHIEERLRAGDKAGAYRLLREFAETHGSARAREAVWRIQRKWDARAERCPEISVYINGNVSSGRSETWWRLWLFGLCTCWVWVRSHAAWIWGWFRQEDAWRKAIDDLFSQRDKRTAVEKGLAESIQPIDELFRAGDKAGAYRGLRGFAGAHDSARVRKPVWRVKRKWDARAEHRAEKSISIPDNDTTGRRQKWWRLWLFGLCACWTWVRFLLVWLWGRFRQPGGRRKTIDGLFSPWDSTRTAIEKGLAGEQDEGSADASGDIASPKKKAEEDDAEKSSREAKQYRDTKGEAKPGGTEDKQDAEAFTAALAVSPDAGAAWAAAGLGAGVSREAESREAVGTEVDEGLGTEGGADTGAGEAAGAEALTAGPAAGPDAGLGAGGGADTGAGEVAGVDVGDGASTEADLETAARVREVAEKTATAGIENGPSGAEDKQGTEAFAADNAVGPNAGVAGVAAGLRAEVSREAESREAVGAEVDEGLGTEGGADAGGGGGAGTEARPGGAEDIQSAEALTAGPAAGPDTGAAGAAAGLGAGDGTDAGAGEVASAAVGDGPSAAAAPETAAQDGATAEEKAATGIAAGSGGAEDKQGAEALTAGQEPAQDAGVVGAAAKLGAELGAKAEAGEAVGAELKDGPSEGPGAEVGAEAEAGEMAGGQEGLGSEGIAQAKESPTEPEDEGLLTGKPTEPTAEDRVGAADAGVSEEAAGAAKEDDGKGEGEEVTEDLAEGTGASAGESAAGAAAEHGADVSQEAKVREADGAESAAAGVAGEKAGGEGKPEAEEQGAIGEDGENLSPEDITAPATASGLADKGVPGGLGKAGAAAKAPATAKKGLAGIQDAVAKDAGKPPGLPNQAGDGKPPKKPAATAELGAAEGAEEDEWDFSQVAAGVDEQKVNTLLGEEIASYRLPRVSLLGQLSFVMFIAKLRFLPMEWKIPTSAVEVKQFAEAFTDSELMVPPNSPLNLFREITLNAYHVNTAKVIGKGFEKYIKGITDAICDAITIWSRLTVFAGVQINGPVGMVTPGVVLGPPLLPFILASAPKDTLMQFKYSMAIATAISTAWQSWQSGLTGTLSYPAFAAFPSPVAPPMPSIPVPLASFSSPGESGLSPSTLKSSMVANFADPKAPHAPQLFESIAQAFNAVFQMFKVTTIVLTVLGMGPIPTFAPPVVPVGPVVGGTSIPIPGAILTLPLGAIPGPTGEYQIALTPFGK